MSHDSAYHGKHKASQGILLLLVVAATLILAPCPAYCQQNQSDDQRQDESMGTTDRSRIGTDERGDSVMQIQPKPKRKQEMPNMGPIYVVPQINQSGRQTGTILPIPQPAAPQAPQAPASHQ